MINTFLTLSDEEADEEKLRPILSELENQISNPKCGLAQEEYLIWAISSDVPEAFLNLLFQVGSTELEQRIALLIALFNFNFLPPDVSCNFGSETCNPPKRI